MSKVLKNLNFLKCYKIDGLLGQATTNFHIDATVIAKAKYSHISESLVHKTLASYQAASQKRLIEEYYSNTQSQELYDSLVAGLLRPKEILTPIFYSYKLVEFNPPEFTIEVYCINENESSLMNTIHNLGISLRSLATCTALKCVKYGFFSISDALLKKEWKIENIVNNMNLCFKLFEDHYSDKIQSYSHVKSGV